VPSASVRRFSRKIRHFSHTVRYKRRTGQRVRDMSKELCNPLPLNFPMDSEPAKRRWAVPSPPRLPPTFPQGPRPVLAAVNFFPTPRWPVPAGKSTGFPSPGRVPSNSPKTADRSEKITLNNLSSERFRLLGQWESNARPSKFFSGANNHPDTLSPSRPSTSPADVLRPVGT